VVVVAVVVEVVGLAVLVSLLGVVAIEDLKEEADELVNVFMIVVVI